MLVLSSHNRSSKDRPRKQPRLLADIEIALPRISIPPRGLMLDFADSPNAYRKSALRAATNRSRLKLGRPMDLSPKLMLAVSVESGANRLEPVVEGS
jgi:hypothetical protein